jgi:hypothetical protein
VDVDAVSTNPGSKPWPAGVLPDDDDEGGGATVRPKATPPGPTTGRREATDAMAARVNAPGSGLHIKQSRAHTYHRLDKWWGE